MHEQAKIDEAKYFLTQLKTLVDDRPAFNFNLSAFLAAARSALQYAHKESKPKTGGPAWYDNAVAGQSTVRFFRDKRDVSIHTNPVSPSATIDASVTETLYLSDSFTATIVRRDGTTEEVSSQNPSPPPHPAPPRTEAAVTYQYFFKDWPGSEDVINLSATYITQLESIISDGVAKGFLTP